MTSIWEKNIAAIRKKQKFLADKLNDIEQNIDTEQYESSVVREEIARDGNPVFVFHRLEKDHFMNSRFRPVSEAITFAEQFENVKDYAVSIIFGFGNGLIPAEVVKKGSDKTRYVFYEPCKDAFLFAMTHYDLSDMLVSDKVFIFVTGINESEFEAYLPLMVEWSNIPLTEIYTLPKYKELFEGEYVEYLKSVKNVIGSAQMGMNTYVARAKQMFKNAIVHTAFAVHTTSTTAFHQVFPKDMPAILVAAGPSLAKNINLLKKAKNHAFILCVDSAYRRLMAEGIDPDAVIDIDAAKYAAYVEQYNDHYKNIMYITSTRANVNMTSQVDSYRTVVFDGDDQINSHIYKELGQPLEVLPTGGSVANNAFSLLESWGFKTIIMIGQDLALTGNKRYSDSTKDAKQEAIDKGFSVFEVDGYNGDKVLTREDYYSYLKWFESTIAISPELNVINATEGGALIKGAKNMPLIEAIEVYAQKEYDVRAMINSVPCACNVENRTELIQDIKDISLHMKNVLRVCEEAIKLAERAKVLILRSNYSQKELLDIEHRLQKIEEKLQDEYIFHAIEERAWETQNKIKRDSICGDEAGNQQEQVLTNIIALYNAYVDAAKEALDEHIPEMLSVLDKQVQKLQ